ncbi:MAG: hypothetical protein ACH349_01515 [Candidatus Rhabdochlamydia sp.]
MSGECNNCSEHCLECRCMEEIKIWAQMFFDDGSVTQGIRINAEWLEEQYIWKIDEVADLLMKSVNRDEGWLLLWGAGNMVFNHYPTSFSKA